MAPAASLFDIDETSDTPGTDAVPHIAFPGAMTACDHIPIMQAANPAAEFYLETYRVQPPDPILEPAPEDDNAPFQFFPRGHSMVPNNNAPPAANGITNMRQRKHSISAWSFCGIVLPHAALRLVSIVVVTPWVTTLLWWKPTLTMAYLSVFVVCLCSYEFSWLAHRIQFQLVSTYDWYENAPKGAASEAGDDPFPFQSFVSGFTQSTSYDFTQDDDDAMEVFGEPVIRRSAVPMAPSPLDSLEFNPNQCVVTKLAESWCYGREWVVKIVFAVPLTVAWLLFSHYVLWEYLLPVGSVPKEVADAITFCWFTNLFAFLCALSTPTWTSAFCLMVHKFFFTSLLLEVLSCPLSVNRSGVCTTGITGNPTHVFIVGAMMLMFVRIVTTKNAMDLIVSTLLEIGGYVYVVGTLMTVISIVDPRDPEAHRSAMTARLLLVLLYVVWISDSVAFLCNAIMRHFQVSHARLFPRRLTMNFDVEATICALGFGTITMLIACEVLGVPGDIGSKVAYAFAGVLVGRFGSLFLTMLKQAAGSRWTSRLVPGFGGVLDAVSTLLFAGLVFAKFYVFVVLG